MAFPANGIIDNFNRADENPINVLWAGTVIPADGRLQVTSNTCKVVTAGGFGSAVLASTYGPDVEAYATFSTVDAGNRCEVYARIVDIDPVNGTDGYCVSQSGGNWTLRIITNSSSSALGATVVQAFASGDSMGIAINGTTLEAWYKSGAGAWTQLFTRTDSTYSGTGSIGARFFSTTYVMDDFGGGSLGYPVAWIRA